MTPPRRLRLPSPAPSPLPRRVLGIDPSLTNTGVALLVDGHVADHLVLSTKATDPEAVRLDHLARALETILRLYRPDEVAVEEFVTFYGRVAPTAIFKMKAAQAVAQLMVLRADLPLFLYSPQLWKPKGDAKAATVRFVQTRFRLATSNDNACDAVAIADYHRRLGRGLRTPVLASPGRDPSARNAALPVVRDASHVARGGLLVSTAIAESAHAPQAATG